MCATPLASQPASQTLEMPIACLHEISPLLALVCMQMRNYGRSAWQAWIQANSRRNPIILPSRPAELYETVWIALSYSLNSTFGNRMNGWTWRSPQKLHQHVFGGGGGFPSPSCLSCLSSLSLMRRAWSLFGFHSCCLLERGAPFHVMHVYTDNIPYPKFFTAWGWRGKLLPENAYMCKRFNNNCQEFILQICCYPR